MVTAKQIAKGMIRRRLGIAGNVENEQRTGLESLLSGGNPAALLNTIQARTSTSAAYDTVTGRDVYFYDSLDELYNTCPPLQTATNIMAHRMLDVERSFVADDAADDPDVERVIDALNTHVAPHMDKVIRLLVECMIRHGRSHIEMVWTLEDGMLLPTQFYHMHPSTVAFDWEGNPYYVTGFSSQDKGTLPSWRILTLTNPDVYGSEYGRSIVFDLRVDAFSYREATKRLVQYLDKFTLPILVATVTADAETGLQMREDLRLQMEALADGGIGLIEMPGAGNLRALDRASATGTAPHFEAIRLAASNIITRIVGSNLGVMEGEYGTRAQAETHNDSTEIIVRSMSRPVATAINSAIVENVLRFNWPDGKDKPSIRFAFDLSETVPIETVEARVRIAREYGLALPKWQVREWLGFANAGEDDETIGGVVAMPTVEGAPVATADGEEKKMPDIFQYHLSAGILTVNEVRKHLGFAPIADGDRFITAADFATGGAATQEFEDGEDDTTAVAVEPKAKWEARNEGGPESDVAAAVEAIPIRPKEIPVLALERGYGDAEMRLAQSVADALRKPARVAVRAALASAAGGNEEPVVEPAIPDEIEDAFLAARLLGLAVSHGVYSRAVEVNKFADASDFADEWKRGVEWMLDRRVATPEMMDRILGAVQRSAEVVDAKRLAAAVRKQFVSFKKTTTEAATDSLRKQIATAVKEGKTTQQFVEEAEKRIARGEIPAMPDAYLRNVARTETSAAYNEERRVFEQDPLIATLLQGWIVRNPDDARSRPSHAALNGRFIKANTPEADALGKPPFSYMCRCVMTPVIGGTLMTMEPDTASIIAAVQRFADGDGFAVCGCPR